MTIVQLQELMKHKQVRVDLYDPLLNIYSIGMDYE